MAAIAEPSTKGFNGTSKLSGIWDATNEGFVPFFSASPCFFLRWGQEECLAVDLVFRNIVVHYRAAAFRLADTDTAGYLGDDGLEQDPSATAPSICCWNGGPSSFALARTACFRSSLACRGGTACCCFGRGTDTLCPTRSGVSGSPRCTAARLPCGGVLHSTWARV